MKETKVIVSSKGLGRLSTQTLVLLIDEDLRVSSLFPRSLKKHLKKITDTGDFEGKSEQSLTLYTETGEFKSLGCKRIVLAGLGKIKDIGEYELNERMRIAGGVIAQNAKKTKSFHLVQNMLLRESWLGITSSRNTKKVILRKILSGLLRFLLRQVEVLVPSEKVSGEPMRARRQR